MKRKQISDFDLSILVGLNWDGGGDCGRDDNDRDGYFKGSGSVYCKNGNDGVVVDGGGGGNGYIGVVVVVYGSDGDNDSGC